MEAARPTNKRSPPKPHGNYDRCAHQRNQRRKEQLTLLLAQRVDPRTIMETLGHSQISLTLNTYSHVLPALQAEAAAKLDAILKG